MIDVNTQEIQNKHYVFIYFAPLFGIQFARAEQQFHEHVNFAVKPSPVYLEWCIDWYGGDELERFYIISVYYTEWLSTLAFLCFQE